MPHNSHSSHTNASPGDDLGSTDEVKVFKDEGDRDDEKNPSENLFEEKSSLIDLTESEEKTGKISTRADPVFGKADNLKNILKLTKSIVLDIEERLAEFTPKL